MFGMFVSSEQEQNGSASAVRFGTSWSRGFSVPAEQWQWEGDDRLITDMLLPSPLT